MDPSGLYTCNSCGGPGTDICDLIPLFCYGGSEGGGGYTGGGGGGGGGNPVNPGHPFVFKRNAYLIWLRNFQLQLALLDQGVFPVPSGGGGGGAPNNRSNPSPLKGVQVCGAGAFAYGGRSLDAGPINGFAGGIVEADTSSGVSKGVLLGARRRRRPHRWGRQNRVFQSGGPRKFQPSLWRRRWWGSWCACCSRRGRV